MYVVSCAVGVSGSYRVATIMDNYTARENASQILTSSVALRKHLTF